MSSGAAKTHRVVLLEVKGISFTLLTLERAIRIFPAAQQPREFLLTV